MRLARILSALSLALVFASCSLDVPDEVGSIVLYLESDKGTLPDGGSVTITATARNVGYQRITLTGQSDCLIYIEVINTSGNVVHRSDTNCTGQTVTEELEAGVDKIQSFVWNGATQAGARAAPGFYSIRGVVRVTNNPYFGPALTIALE